MMKKIFNIDEFSKQLIWLFAINSVIWIYLSYALAFLGKEQIAETLSTTIVAEIIGITLVYCAKSLFENISKHNNWPDKGNCENNNINVSQNDNEITITNF